MDSWLLEEGIAAVFEAAGVFDGPRVDVGIGVRVVDDATTVFEMIAGTVDAV